MMKDWKAGLVSLSVIGVAALISVTGAIFAAVSPEHAAEESRGNAVREIVKQAPDVLSSAQFSIRAYQGYNSTCTFFLVQDARGELFQACLIVLTNSNEVLMTDLKRI